MSQRVILSGIKPVVACLLLMAGIMTGCKPTSSSPTENDIAFDSIEVRKTYHLLEEANNPSCELQIKFLYPKKYAHSDVLPSIQKAFISAYFGELYNALSPADAVARYVEDYLKEYKELEPDFVEESKNEDIGSVSSWFSYYENSTNEILYNKNGLLSFSVFIENYTGGAHGGHLVTNRTLNLQTGNFVREDEIFIDGYQDELSQLIVQALTADNNLTAAIELENIGFFSVEEIFPNKNFYVNEEGITYTFNEYEIANYVMGAIEVTLTYDHIRHLLREESPIAKLAL